jgi:hypothetical protein
VFVALADQRLKAGGRLALVLPRSVLNGVAWGKTRQRIVRDYVLQYIIVSHEPDRWNFSENTELSEALIVARKRLPDEVDETERVTCVNFSRQPRTAIEALSVAAALTGSPAPDVNSGLGCLRIAIGDKKLGEAISVPWSLLKTTSWNFPCAFAQSELVRIYYQLLQGNLNLPGRGKVAEIKLAPLLELAGLGPDPRDVYDGFDLVTEKTQYPAFWGHAAEAVKTMQQSPNRYLTPLSKAKPGRPLRKFADLWPKASRVLIAQRPWLNTKSVIAVRVASKVLGDVWCPVILSSDGEEAEKALTIWLNSTLGLLMLLGHREETRGAWVQFKKPELEAMPVLDIHGVDTKTLHKLAEAYDDFALRSLKPFPDMASDSSRDALDRAVASALNIPDFSPLRELLAREPILCLGLDRL